MGYAAVLIILLLEAFLACYTCIRKPKKSTWKKQRLCVRGIEAAGMILLLLCSRQRWRFIPGLFLLVILLILSVFSLLLGSKAEKTKKALAAVLSCLLSALLLCLFLAPALLFTDYSGLPISGPHKVLEAKAILIDQARLDPFVEDQSYREVPVHFYYPAELEEISKYKKP